MQLRLEDKLVRALGPGEYSDTVQRGLVLRVRSSGDRTYGVRYRPKSEGNPRRFRLGSVATLSLAQARGRAREVLARVELGENPQEEKTEARRSAKTDTLAVLLDRFVEDQAPRWRPKTLTEFRRLLKREVLPVFGSRQPQEIRRGDARADREDEAYDGEQGV